MRADFTAADTQLADAQEARREVASLTRFLDLNKVNKRHHPDDFNEDEIASGSEPDEDDAVMTCSLLQGDSAPPMTWPPQRELTLEEIEEQMDQSCEPMLGSNVSNGHGAP